MVDGFWWGVINLISGVYLIFAVVGFGDFSHPLCDLSSSVVVPIGYWLMVHG